MGGMRKSNSNNCLVLISDHTKDLYEDKWHGDVLHYTGMGKVGDQDKEWMQNGTLYHSPTNGVVLYLFEVLERKQYTYRGIVELCGEPYTEFQPDENGDTRKVWMFPIRPVTGAPTISAETLQQMNAANKQKSTVSIFFIVFLSYHTYLISSGTIRISDALSFEKIKTHKGMITPCA